MKITPLIQSKKLSHIALKSPNVRYQAKFYRDIVGMHAQAIDSTGNIYMRCDADHHALVLMPADEPGLDHHAIDVGGPANLDAAVNSLVQAGIALQAVDHDELGQMAACRLHDPDGFLVELVAGMEQITDSVGPRAVVPRRYGHLMLRSKDVKQAMRFYTEILGFQVSDWLGEKFCWLRCNPEHHGIALSAHDRAPMMHHFAFHVRDMGELIQQAEHLMHNGRHLLYGPGRHGPGGNLFIYFHDNDQNIVEFAADMEQIWDDDSYEPKVWDPNERWSNMWGPPSLPEFLD